ncbi:hypothetical protein CK203_076980 [Vitis vinifera]|uniref:Uncharacterized protein n=1 Tax=Vitis vinifera TaxID=29760 RepID=A0A438E0G9_VITVI|nr:hypothetical protein CK203_076980 [Vitis vinifera]
MGIFLTLSALASFACTRFFPKLDRRLDSPVAGGVRRLADPRISAPPPFFDQISGVRGLGRWRESVIEFMNGIENLRERVVPRGVVGVDDRVEKRLGFAIW